MYTFFEENGRKLFGQSRFGRAIEYSIGPTATGAMEVRFKPGFILAEDEANMPEISKEMLVCECASTLAQMYKIVYVRLTAFDCTIKMTDAENIFDFEDKLQVAKKEYLKKMDIF